MASIPIIIEKVCSLHSSFAAMVKKKVVVESTIPFVEELVILVDHPQVLANQGSGKPLAIPSIMVE